MPHGITTNEPGEVRLEFRLQAGSRVFRHSRLLSRSFGIVKADRTVGPA